MSIALTPAYRLIFESLPQGVLLLDGAGMILAVNRAASEWLGLATAPEQEKGSFLTRVVDEQRAAVSRMIAEVFRGETRTTEVEIGGQAHSRRRWVLWAGPLRDDGGEIQAALSVIRPARQSETTEVVNEGPGGQRGTSNALQDSQEHLTALINAVDGIVWEADANTFQFTFVSPRAERLLGYPLSRWTEEPTFWLDHLHPDDREQAASWCRRCTREGRGHEFEYRMLASDGRALWLRDIVTVVMENGRATKLRGIMVDITAQKLADQRIRRLNRTYAVLSDINELIVRERRADAITHGACQIAVAKGEFALAWLGLIEPTTGRLKRVARSSAVPAALEVTDVILAGDVPMCPWTRQVLEQGGHAICNDVARERDSTGTRDLLLRHGLHAAISLALTIEGRRAGVFSLYATEAGFFDADEVRLLDELATDIAFALQMGERERERQRAIEQLRVSEDELRRREEHFRLLIENASDLIIVVNHAGVIRFESPSVEHVFGGARHEMIGRNALDFVHPDDVAATTAALREAIAAPTSSVSIEHRVRRSDGQWRILHTIGRSIPGQAEDGFIVLNARDITESRALEEQFRQSQKMEAIGQLAGGVAHDFNNILAAIMMQAELAAMTGGLPDDVRESLQIIRGASERAANLTRQLLLFSRRQVMQPRELDLNEIVTSLARMLQRIIGEDVRLQLHLHPAPLVIRADAGMIDQVLLNLSVNARDAMPRGGRLLIETTTTTLDTVPGRAHPEVPAGSYAMLSVADTGTGIPPEVLPRIFEPFFTTKEQGKGTGLGLATVFGIVKQHRGWISVQSEPDCGATFTILLPLCPASCEPAERLTPPPKPRGGTETILIAEDDPTVRLVTRAVLERAGYRVIEAVSGADALELWKKHEAEIDLLLTDLVMPAGVSGYELARQVQAQRPKLAVIFVSGYSADVAGREVELKSGENFLQKPFSADALLAAVRRGLERRTEF